MVVAASLLWNALILLPIYVLGLLGYLTGLSLGLASVLVSAGAFAIASRGVGIAPMLRRTGEAAVGVLRLPFDALAICWRQRSLVFVGVAFAMLLLPYLGLSAWLAQPLPNWDPLWYHDTIVGLTIQNHSFAMVDLPVTLQKVNGYVRLAEMTQLWMVIFADRRLADMTNLLFAPLLAASTYVLARRYAGKVPSIGWGLGVLLIPTNIGFLHSTYVDPQYGALLMGAVVFATVDRPRFRDACLASLALALTIGSKGLALVTVPVTGLVGAWLFLREHWHDRRRAALCDRRRRAPRDRALVASTTYLRNYWTFHNPFWPRTCASTSRPWVFTGRAPGALGRRRARAGPLGEPQRAVQRAARAVVRGAMVGQERDVRAGRRVRHRRHLDHLSAGCVRIRRLPGRGGAVRAPAAP